MQTIKQLDPNIYERKGNDRPIWIIMMNMYIVFIFSFSFGAEKKNILQWKLSITRSLGPWNFVCYIRYFVISVSYKQYKTKQNNVFNWDRRKQFFISRILLYEISLYRVSTVSNTGKGKHAKYKPESRFPGFSYRNIKTRTRWSKSTWCYKCALMWILIVNIHIFLVYMYFQGRKEKI